MPLGILMIKRDLFVTPIIKIKLMQCWPVLVLVFLPVIQKGLEELMGWHPSRVARSRIRVIGVNFSEFLLGK